MIKNNNDNTSLFALLPRFLQLTINLFICCLIHWLINWSHLEKIKHILVLISWGMPFWYSFSYSWNTDTHTPTYLPACLPAYLPTYLPTYLHTCILTYINTYIYIIIYTSSFSSLLNSFRHLLFPCFSHWLYDLLINTATLATFSYLNIIDFCCQYFLWTILKIDLVNVFSSY